MRGRDEGAQEDEATHICSGVVGHSSALTRCLLCPQCLWETLGLLIARGGTLTTTSRCTPPPNRAVLTQLSSFASGRPGRQGRILTATLTLPADAMVSGVRPAGYQRPKSPSCKVSARVDGALHKTLEVWGLFHLKNKWQG